MLFDEFAKSIGVTLKIEELFGLLFKKALEGEPDCGGLLAYNYYSGEHITGFEEGRPLFVRTPDSNMNLANFMRVHLFTALGALKTGLDILIHQENVKVDTILGHGGFFTQKEVSQKIVAAAMDTPVSVMNTASEGGAWGIALLASYMNTKKEGESLESFLQDRVFVQSQGSEIAPKKEDVEGFNVFIKRYLKGLPIERAAVDNL